MLRALQILGDALIRDGAPALVRSTGSGSADSVVVAIDAPWQKISVRTEQFEGREPFIFTRSLVAEKLEATAVVAPGKVLADQSVIGTILNGYETRDPYGKEVRRASVIALTSSIDESVAGSITSVLGGIYHTKHIESIAGSSLRYQALRKAFPHEHDVLILDATGPFTSVALMRRGLLVSISEVTSGTDAPDTWLESVRAELAELARRFPLPRTIFLLARESDTDALREALDTAKLGNLWLSDDPPRIVPVLANHITALVRQVSPAPPDLPLLLMALYYQQRSFE